MWWLCEVRHDCSFASADLSQRLVPDGLWDLVVPLLPSFAPSPQGGGTAPVDERSAVRIARPGIESSERLGWHRWKIERSIAWLFGYRRLSIRYDAREVISSPSSASPPR